MKVNWATSPSNVPKQDTSSEYITDMSYISPDTHFTHFLYIFILYSEKIIPVVL